MTWGERNRRAREAWQRWSGIPFELRMDRVLKEAGVRELIVDRDRYGDALGRIRDGIYSGNQAAEVAATALRDQAPSSATASAPQERS